MTTETRHCLLCNIDEAEKYGELSEDEFWEHVDEVHPDVPSNEALTATISSFLNDLVEFSDRLDEMAEVYRDLPFYARNHHAQAGIEGAAIKVRRARYEMEKTIGDSE